jgi:hypothetical protein
VRGEPPASLEALARELHVPDGCKPAAEREMTVAANWKVLAEQWLEAAASSGGGLERTALPPNQLRERADEHVRILQLIPLDPQQSRIRLLAFASHAGTSRPSREAWLEDQIAEAESTQVGLALAGAEYVAPASASPELASFHRKVRELIAAAGDGR